MSLTVSAPTARPTRRDWLGLATLATGLGMIVLDGTIVGVAMPQIIRDLHLDITDAQWVSSLYAVVLAALLLVAGRAADRWGRRGLFVAGVVVFVAGSVVAGAAGDASALIGARVVQAAGAALILPTTLSIVNATFRGRDRAAAFGVWGAVISGAAALGPLVGGALTQYASWPWIFYVNVPIGIVVVVAALLTVRESRGESGPGTDAIGAVLSAVGFGALVCAVIEGPDLGWWAPKRELDILGVAWPTTAPVSLVPPLFVLAVASLGGFVWWELRRLRTGRAVLLDLRLFRLRTFAWGNVAAATIAVGEFAIVFVLPLYLVDALGLDTMHSGLVLAAMAGGAFLSGASARHLSARIGAPRVVLLGLGLEVAGILVLALVLGPQTAGWIVAAPLVVYGLGLGLASAQLTGTVLRDVPTEASGQGSATQSTVRQVGSALGTAISGAALSVALAFTLPNALTGVPDAAHVAETVRTSAGSAILAMRAGGGQSAVVDALAGAFADATRISLLAASVFLILGFVAALRVRRAAEESA
jgi:EmrB/QacA subfamily drug resistance transporter